MAISYWLVKGECEIEKWKPNLGRVVGTGLGVRHLGTSDQWVVGCARLHRWGLKSGGALAERSCLAVGHSATQRTPPRVGAQPHKAFGLRHFTDTGVGPGDWGVKIDVPAGEGVEQWGSSGPLLFEYSRGW